MKKLNKPELSFEECYKTCQCSHEKSERLLNSMCTIEQAQVEYEELAKKSMLHTYRPITLEDSVKKDLKSLYTYDLVDKRRHGRAVYDKILISSPLCPYCNLGHSRTLDHYLAKFEYPEFSINPLNLIPACRDCNTEKLDKVIQREDEQYIHPYFDTIDFQWLDSKVSFKSKPIIEYCVKEDILNNTLGKRVSYHFYSLRINKLYETQANVRLQTLHESFKSLKEHLRAYLIEESKKYPINHWEKSFYKCLADSDEFCGLTWEM